MNAPDMVIFSYVLSGWLQFINGVDGCGIHYHKGRGLNSGYWEFEIDMDIPQQNEFDKVGRNDEVKVLYIEGYKLKANINDNMSHIGKIDFSACELNIPYAIKFADNEILRPNEKIAENIIKSYPDLDLKDFFNKSLIEFSK